MYTQGKYKKPQFTHRYQGLPEIAPVKPTHIPQPQIDAYRKSVHRKFFARTTVRAEESAFYLADGKMYTLFIGPSHLNYIDGIVVKTATETFAAIDDFATVPVGCGAGTRLFKSFVTL